MKKLIALLLAVAMMGCVLCACGSGEETKETSPAKAETTPVQAETSPAGSEEETTAPIEEDEDDEDDEELTDEEALALCLSLLGSSVDLDHYDEPEVEDGDVYLYYTDENSVEDHYTDLDYNVEVMDGLTVTLNGVTTYQDLVDAGFAGGFNATIESLTRYVGTCKNENGNWFTATIANPTKADISVGECFVTSITLNPTYAPDFNVNGITAGSTVADVVKAYGEPYYIAFGYTGLSLQFHNEESGMVSFSFDQDGVLFTVTYNYDSNNLL